MKSSRLLERFWSIYLLGELGPGRVLRGFIRGLLFLAISLILLVFGIAAAVLLLSKFPNVAARIFSFLLQIVVLVVLIKFVFSIIRSMFR